MHTPTGYRLLPPSSYHAARHTIGRSLQPPPRPQPCAQVSLRCAVLPVSCHLLQNIGPRHAFAVSKGVEAKLRVPGGACSSSRIRQQGGAWSWDLSLLVRGEDVDFVEALGGSVNEYDGFRTSFEEEYTTKLSIAAGETLGRGVGAHADCQCAPPCRPLWLGCGGEVLAVRCCLFFVTVGASVHHTLFVVKSFKHTLLLRRETHLLLLLVLPLCCLLVVLPQPRSSRMS